MCLQSLHIAGPGAARSAERFKRGHSGFDDFGLFPHPARGYHSYIAATHRQTGPPRSRARAIGPIFDCRERMRSGALSYALDGMRRQDLMMRERIFALLGYELVEGAVAEGVMREVREVRRGSFAPEASRTTSRD
jgi:hypothetical protein